MCCGDINCNIGDGDNDDKVGNERGPTQDDNDTDKMFWMIMTMMAMTVMKLIAMIRDYKLATKIIANLTIMEKM